MKKTISLLLALALALSLSIAPASAAEEPVWQALFKTFLSRQTMTDIETAFLADLDMSGAPELFYLSGANFVAMTARGNSLLPVGAFTLGGEPIESFGGRLKNIVCQMNLYRKNKGGYVWLLNTRHSAGGMSGELLYMNGAFGYNEQFSTTRSADGDVLYLAHGLEVSKQAFDILLARYESKMTDTGIGGIVSGSGQSAWMMIDEMAKRWLALPAEAIPAKSLKLNKTKATMYAGDCMTLTAARKPAYATGTVLYSSSDERLATVGEDGEVQIVGLEGKVTVTATLGKLSKKCDITIKRPALESIEVAGAIAVNAGEGTQLTVVCEPYGAKDDVTWSSSDETVARVSATGYVTGAQPGTAVVTAKAVGAKKNRPIQGALKITVGQPDAAQSGPITRRAVLVSHGMEVQETRRHDGAIFEYELLQMKNALSQATFGGAGRMSFRRVAETETGAQALEGIYDALRDADENDVSYVLIQCHGRDPRDGGFGMLLGTMEDLVTAAQLKATLDKVKGKIVLLLGCCYSGDAIDKGAARDMARITDRAIAAFANAPVSKSGELCEDKYQVMCAASQIQMSWFTYDMSLDNWFGNGLFFQAIGEGIGYDVTQPAPTGAWLADENGDGSVTLAEMAAYATPRVKQLYYESPGIYMSDEGELGTAGVQHVQVWPDSSDFTLFAK